MRWLLSCGDYSVAGDEGRAPRHPRHAGNHLLVITQEVGGHMGCVPRTARPHICKQPAFQSVADCVIENMCPTNSRRVRTPPRSSCPFSISMMFIVIDTLNHTVWIIIVMNIKTLIPAPATGFTPWHLDIATARSDDRWRTTPTHRMRVRTYADIADHGEGN